MFSFLPESTEKSKCGSEEDLLLKKLKKKKKKKHKDGERVKERHSRPKMHHRSCQTVCSGVSLALPEFLSRINGNKSINSSNLLQTSAAPQHQHQDPPLPAATSASLRLGYSSPVHCTPVPSLPGLEFGHLIHIEQQANGGASVAHAYSDQLSCLSPAEMQRFAEEFVTLSFSEDEAQAACFVMGIIHGAASYLPDFLDYFSYKFPNAPVKMEVLGKKDIETTTMVNFHSQVRRGVFIISMFFFSADGITICLKSPLRYSQHHVHCQSAAVQTRPPQVKTRTSVLVQTPHLPLCPGGLVDQ